jgi:hypothetical protein
MEKGVNSSLRGNLIAGLLGGIFCVSYLFGLNLLNQHARNSPRIGEKDNKFKEIKSLDFYLKKGKRELGIENKNIEVVFLDIDSDNYEGKSYAVKKGENSYQIGLKFEDMQEGCLDHELYHIADGSCDKKDNILRYLFIDEPKAALYGAYSIKLKLDKNKMTDKNYDNCLMAKVNGFELTSDGYFPNRSWRTECGITSLANLIYYEYDDFETAMKIFLNSKKSSLVGRTGNTHLALFPAILEELSEDKYYGLCQLNPDQSLFRHFDSLKGCSSNLLKDSVKTHLEKGSYNFSENITFQDPYMLLLSNSASGHALVNAGNYFIDNGDIQELMPKGFYISGAFKAFKK